jgi:bifunctional non-homologous end joining protein LigD
VRASSRRDDIERGDSGVRSLSTTRAGTKRASKSRGASPTKHARRPSASLVARSSAASRPRDSAGTPRARKSASKPTDRASTTSTSVAALARALPNARRAPLPGFVPVELARLVDAAPDGASWVHEVKYDGYRMLVELDTGDVRWFSRNGIDRSARAARLSPAIASLRARTALIDGELAVVDERGVSHFQELQQALGEKTSAQLTFFAFDLLHVDGYDLRDCALLDRKRLLKALLDRVPAKSGVHFSDHIAGDGPGFLRSACEHRLEGVVSKRADSPYRSGRSGDWLKSKCGNRQELVVVGFTEPQGMRSGIGALVLAVNEHKGLRFAGRVGTGFDQRTLASLRKTLESARTERCPLATPPTAAQRRGVHWVEPRIVVEVAFTDWTADGSLRHPSFVGIRDDKLPKDVVREMPPPSHRTTRAKGTPRARGAGETRVSSARVRAQPARSNARKSAPARRATRAASDAGAVVAGVEITHPERVLDVESGITKLDLARYYERAAPLLLPHIVERPLSVVRCPDTFSGACFFQKHARQTFPRSVKSIALRDSSGPSEYLTIDSLEGLIALAQMNVVELHPWGSRADQLERPDRMVFDLDPAPDVPWRRVVEAALNLRDVLAKLDVDSFVKTAGGKGLHVVVPLARAYSWDKIKEFSHALALELARAEPKQYVAQATKSLRKGRIFIDYLRNARGATAVAPYSVRARAGAPLSMPVAWSALTSVTSGAEFHLEHGVEWKKPYARDPWAGILRSEQVLPRVAW